MFKITLFRCSLAAVTVTSSILLSSCASSNRMMRLSPLRQSRHYDSLKSGGVKLTEKSIVQFDRPTGRNNFAERFDDRINIWPFLYKEGNFTSAMWPFIDMDPYGIAVRPFYNQEGNEYSVMFPLSAWNPVKGDGWAALYYWNRAQGMYGAAPFFHIKYDGDTFQKYFIFGGLLNHYSVNGENDFSFSLLNYIQSRNGTKSYNTFIPLYLYKTSSNSWSFWTMPTIYNSWREVKVHKSDELVKENHYTSTFLPLYYYQYNNDNNYWLWVLNSYYNRQDDNRAHAFMPLYLYNKAGDNSLLQILLWIQKDKKYFASRTLFPLWHCSYRKDNNDSYHVSPFYYYNSEGDTNKTLWILNYLYNRKGDQSDSMLFPLYFYGNNPEKQKEYLLVLGGLLGHYNLNKNQKSMSILNFYKDDDNHALIPIYWYNSENGKHLNVLGLSGLSYEHDQLQRLYVLPLFWYERDSLLWAFPYVGKQTDTEKHSGILPLYVYASSPNQDELLIYPLLSSFKTGKDYYSGNILFPFGGYDIKQNSSSSYFWPLYKYEHASNNYADANGLFVFKYVDCKYPSYNIFSSFSIDDYRKANIPLNKYFKQSSLLFGREEEVRQMLNYGTPELSTPHISPQNHNYTYRKKIFPFFTTTTKEQRWDFSKINAVTIKRINHIIFNIQNAELFEKDFQYYKDWTHDSNSSGLKATLKYRFQLELDIKKPVLIQLNSFRSTMAQRKNSSLIELKAILEENSCKIKDASKSEILKGLYDLQQTNSYDYTTEKSFLFPIAYWRHSTDAWAWWFAIAYANRDKSICYDPSQLSQMLDGNISKLPLNDSFNHGVFPLYFYSSEKNKTSLIIPALLSGYSSSKKEPDCGFPEKVFGQAMKESSLKSGEKTSGNWMILFKTESEYSDSVLPVPEKSSGKAITRADKQLFWLYNNWHEEYKYWDYEKVNQFELKKVMSAVATLIDLDYWQLIKETEKDKVFQASDYYRYKYNKKYKIKGPADLKAWVEKSKNDLKAGFKALEIENINIDDRNKLFSALIQLDKKYTVGSECGKTIIPLLYYRKYNKDRDYWNILLLLSDYEKEGKYSKFSILKYLLRIEQDKDLYSCDVFPFINYSSKKDNTSFSFLWRLLRVERENNSFKKLYLGFIPFYSRK